jgi:hypothetical protein
VGDQRVGRGQASGGFERANRLAVLVERAMEQRGS